MRAASFPRSKREQACDAELYADLLLTYSDHIGHHRPADPHRPANPHRLTETDRGAAAGRCPTQATAVTRSAT
ncbi:hypothetical protein [Lentzea sp. CA-135723]|uniref:hypothetical protein n=1 Tax=Lentzea sp. CA-135723 TaxID=3239950 RepID=UPI003D9370CF